MRDEMDDAELYDELALLLPDTLPARELPPHLRARILATARADLAPVSHDTAWISRGTVWAALLRPLAGGRLLAAGLAVVVLLLVAVDVRAGSELAASNAERAEYAAVLAKVSHGGQTWYMAGLDQWAGSGGTLMAPAKPDAKPVIVFHDLHAIPNGTTYAVWLVDTSGHWARAANFVPDGEAMQAVDLDAPIDGYAQCALTIETAREGARQGPLVMQSRLAQTQ